MNEWVIVIPSIVMLLVVFIFYGIPIIVFGFCEYKRQQKEILKLEIELKSEQEVKNDTKNKRMDQ